MANSDTHEVVLERRCPLVCMGALQQIILQRSIESRYA
jgi:hypothetical protein